MKTLRIVALASAVFTAATVHAIEYRGSFTGTWTTGVPEFGINAGDSFTWDYVSTDEWGLTTVNRTPVPGLTAMDTIPTGFIAFHEDQVVNATINWQFSNPMLPRVDLFFVFADTFSGWGEGIITWSPVSKVPETLATLPSLFAALLLLAILRGTVLAGDTLRPR